MDLERRGERRRAAAIRRGDHSKYTALRWVSTLFRCAAVFLVVAVIAECIAGVRAEGWVVLPFLLGEVARVTILSILLWAGGDLVHLLLQLGRDLRAERLILARIADRTPARRHRAMTLSGSTYEGERLSDHTEEAEGGVGDGEELGWGTDIAPNQSTAP